MNKTFYKHYVFLEEINDLLQKNLVKLNNVNIIIDINQNDKENLKLLVRYIINLNIFKN